MGHVMILLPWAVSSIYLFLVISQNAMTDHTVVHLVVVLIRASDLKTLISVILEGNDKGLL